VSQLESYQTEIDGWSYRMKHLSVRKSMWVLTRIMKVLAPGVDSASDAAEQIAQAGADFFGTVAQNLDPETLWATMMDMAEVCEAKQGAGQWTELAPMFEHHFFARDMGMLLWFVWALKSQYSPLLAGLAARNAEEAGDEAGATNETTTTSPG